MTFQNITSSPQETACEATESSQMLRIYTLATPGTELILLNFRDTQNTVLGRTGNLIKSPCLAGLKQGACK